MNVIVDDGSRLSAIPSSGLPQRAAEGCGCLLFQFYTFISSRAAIIPAAFARWARFFRKFVFSCPILPHFCL
jgi:hypothetical protein